MYPTDCSSRPVVAITLGACVIVASCSFVNGACEEVTSHRWAPLSWANSRSKGACTLPITTSPRPTSSVDSMTTSSMLAVCTRLLRRSAYTRYQTAAPLRALLGDSVCMVSPLLLFLFLFLFLPRRGGAHSLPVSRPDRSA